MNTEANKEKSNLNSIGERLRRAREQMCLTQQNVAERLCLKLSTVRDIEEDKSPTDLASTFLRGYIRSYARLVRVPEEELLLMMSKQTPVRTAKVEPIQSVALGKRRKKRDSWVMIFTWLVLFIVVGLTGAWWWQNHKAAKEDLVSMAAATSQQNTLMEGKSDPDESIPIDVTPTHALSDNNSQSDIHPPMVVSPNTASVNGTAGLYLPSTSSVSQPATERNIISINFTSDCWLEVTDAANKKLFSGLQRIGGKLSLAGIAPYRLKIGAPAAVQIEYQGKSVDLSRFILNNQVARLTLGIR